MGNGCQNFSCNSWKRNALPFVVLIANRVFDINCACLYPEYVSSKMWVSCVFSTQQIKPESVTGYVISTYQNILNFNKNHPETKVRTCPEIDEFSSKIVPEINKLRSTSQQLSINASENLEKVASQVVFTLPRSCHGPLNQRNLGQRYRGSYFCWKNESSSSCKSSDSSKPVINLAIKAWLSDAAFYKYSGDNRKALSCDQSERNLTENQFLQLTAGFSKEVHCKALDYLNNSRDPRILIGCAYEVQPIYDNSKTKDAIFDKSKFKSFRDMGLDIQTCSDMILKSSKILLCVLGINIYLAHF